MQHHRLRLLALTCGAFALAACRGQKPEVETPQPAPRERVSLAGPWRFVGSDALTGGERADLDDRSWEEVRLPHTWAMRDPHPHSHAWYRMRFTVPWHDAGQRLYLQFEGVATIADVYVNGRHLGQHRGAFTRFVLDATDAVKADGENLLAVRVDNTLSDTADCLPSGASERQLYNIYGGIYRSVWLLKTAATHIDPTDHAAPGAYLAASHVSKDSADFSLRVLARNSQSAPQPVEFRSYLCDHEHRVVTANRAEATLDPQARREIALRGAVDRPRLWSPADPYLYELNVELWQESRLVDRVTQRVGFRDFRLSNGQFVLNGAPILLRGVGKHQENERSLSALSDSDIEDDFAHLHDLGVNMVRLAHYPHADLAYELADRYGILVWAENGNSNPSESSDTGDVITREMVRQNFNHPSIVVWAVGNETDYFGVARYAAIVRADDPSRLITYAADAADSGLKPKARRQLDFVSHNLYAGWYKEEPSNFQVQATAAHFVSETGGGEVISHHSNYGREQKTVDVLETEEYRQLMAESQFQLVFRSQPQDVPMYLLWVLRDFTVPSMRKFKGMNTKGLLTRDGFRKDVYYLYRCFLRPETPTVHIASQTYFVRRGISANFIKVYSNQGRLTLTVNGAVVGTRENGAYRSADGQRVDNVFFWREPLQPGHNVVRVSDDAGHSDSAILYYWVPPSRGTMPPDQGTLIRDLRSSNRKNLAYFMDAPVQEQWPFYYDFNGTADNTFAGLPLALRDARWLATRRVSKPENRTQLTFSVAPESHGVDVGILISADERAPQAWLNSGFRDTGLSGEWRDNDLRRKPFKVLARAFAAGQRVRIDPATLDYVVVLKERASRRDSRPFADAPARASVGEPK
jgi:beta-galactosidase